MKRMASYGLAAVFVITALVQLTVPVSMILRRETVLRQGAVYRFRTRPVDPYDAFRGRYVALGFEQNSVPVPNAGEYRRGRWVYVSLEADSDGAARLAGISLSRPAAGDYLKTRVQYVTGGSSNVVVKMPFDRYYMNENDAPAAEAAYNAASRRAGAKTAFAVVRVQKGMAVLEELLFQCGPVGP